MVSLHECSITRVYNSGLVDARSLNKSRLFSRINIARSSGTEAKLELGDQILVVCDGSRYYGIGVISPPRLSEDGASTITNERNDLADIDDAKSLISTDGFGNTARLIVSRGAGVIADTGEFCTTHWDAGKNMKREYYERKRVISEPHYCDSTHNNRECETVYHWRTSVDADAVNREIDSEIIRTLDSGNTVTAQIGPGDDVLSIVTRNSGIPQSTIEIDNNGAITVTTISDIEASATGNIDVSATGSIDSSAIGGITESSGTSSVTINPSGAIELSTVGGTINVNNLGQIYLGQTIGVNLLLILDQLLTQLGAATTVTILGTQPLLPLNPAGANALKALLKVIKGSA